MTIELIQSNSDFFSLKEEWNNLLNISASHVPFLRHEYLTTWWSTLGGGEWNRGELAVLLQRDNDGTLTGIAPFFLAEQQIRFLGSIEISDYLDLISSQENIAAFSKDILSFIGSDRFPIWQSLILENLLDLSPTIQAMNNAADEAGFQIDQRILHPAPYLELPGKWEDYLANLDEHYRHEIERKIRKAEGYFLPVDWYIVDEIGDLESEMSAFLELMAGNPEKDRFLTKAMSEQMMSVAKAAFKEGWLQLAFLKVGELKVAGYMNFDFDGKIWVYNSGINPMFENISPGWVLLTQLIKWSIQEGRSIFDFMRGNESYKYQFGGIDKHILQLTITK